MPPCDLQPTSVPGYYDNNCGYTVIPHKLAILSANFCLWTVCDIKLNLGVKLYELNKRNLRAKFQFSRCSRTPYLRFDFVSISALFITSSEAIDSKILLSLCNANIHILALERTVYRFSFSSEYIKTEKIYFCKWFSPSFDIFLSMNKQRNCKIFGEFLKLETKYFREQILIEIYLALVKF